MDTKEQTRTALAEIELQLEMGSIPARTVIDHCKVSSFRVISNNTFAIVTHYFNGKLINDHQCTYEDLEDFLLNTLEAGFIEKESKWSGLILT